MPLEEIAGWFEETRAMLEEDYRAQEAAIKEATRR